MGIGAGVDELRVDPQMIARPLHAAFEEMRDAELLPDLPRVAGFTSLVRAGGGAADHFEIGDFGQIGENFILDARRKVGVLLVVAQVLEGQHRDAFLGRRSSLFDFDATKTEAPAPERRLTPRGPLRG